jgi:hypothetical protein
MTARNFYSGWKLPGSTGPGLSLEVRFRKPYFFPRLRSRDLHSFYFQLNVSAFCG